MRAFAPQSTNGCVRLGLIVPSVNTVVEPWFAHAAPPRVSVHAARMLLADNLSPEKIVEMDREQGMLAIRQIASCRPHAVAYCCTASSVVQGHAYDKHLRAEITRITGVPSTTATSSILDAFLKLGVTRITVVSPYTDEVDKAEHCFFAAAGIEVMSSGNLNIADSFRLADPSPSEILDLALKAWHPDADALLISCLNLRSHEVITELERQIGKPVVTSTQATFWKLMRLADISDCIAGFGRLLREH
jgi:maleate isomerase